jgi:hypothetical protein
MDKRTFAKRINQLPTQAGAEATMEKPSKGWPRFILAVGAVSEIVKPIGEIAKQVRDSSDIWTAAMNVHIGDVLSPLGLLLIIIGLWWSQRQDLRGLIWECNAALKQLKEAAEKNADNFSQHQQWEAEHKDELVKAALDAFDKRTSKL